MTRLGRVEKDGGKSMRITPVEVGLAGNFNRLRKFGNLGIPLRGRKRRRGRSLRRAPQGCEWSVVARGAPAAGPEGR